MDLEAQENKFTYEQCIENVGDNIVKELQKKKITQAKVAAEIGISPNTLSNYIHKVSGITVYNALLISDYFKIPLEDFLRKKL
jgi:hypothetical protein